MGTILFSNNVIKKKIVIWDSNMDQPTQQKRNEEQAWEFLKTAFPDLYELERKRNEFGIEPGDLLDFMYHLKHILTHGHGTVLAVVLDGQISKFEGMIRTIKKRETTEVVRSSGRK